MFSRLFTLLAVAVLMLPILPLSAHAGAITDNGWYTTDGDTGLDWLDLTLTLGKSYNDVLGNTATDGTYAPSGWYAAGWQVASRAQVLQFWTNVTGFTVWDNGFNPAINNATTMIGSYVGLTFGTSCPSSTCETRGFIAEDYDISNSYEAFLVNDDPTHLGNDFSSTYSWELKSDQIAYAATWLIRPISIPEPGTLLLFATGLFVLAYHWRRRKPA